MPHQYKHKEWERYFPMVPLVTWIKSQNLRKFKSWTYTGIAWTFLLGTTTLYLTDWNPIQRFLPTEKNTEPSTDNIDPSDNSLYQKVAYGCGFYKFIRPSCKLKTDNYEPKNKKVISEPKDVQNVLLTVPECEDDQSVPSVVKSENMQHALEVTESKSIEELLTVIE